MSEAKLVREWRGQMEKFATSGLTVQEFCKREGFTKTTFYGWRKRLQQESDAERAAFVEVTAAPTPAPPIELVLPAGITVRVHAGCDVETLARVLEVVDGR